MSRDVRWRINTPRVTSQIIDGEAIMINLESGNYYNLNAAGTSIWDCIERGVSVGEMPVALALQYDIDQTNVEDSVAGLIAELAQEELVVIDEAEEAAREAHVAAQSSPAANRTSQIRQKFEAPVLQKYTDMQDLLLLDPIHEVDELGWPRAKGVRDLK
jgi:hypothetical protein